jgi:hypothetical protein
VDIFFDTTVLVAASEQSHPHYAQARPALLRVAAGRDKGFMGLHSIAEVHATLTRLPIQPRIHPVEAARIVTDNILPHFEVVSLGKEGYLEARLPGPPRMRFRKPESLSPIAISGEPKAEGFTVEVGQYQPRLCPPGAPCAQPTRKCCGCSYE